MSCHAILFTHALLACVATFSAEIPERSVIDNERANNYVIPYDGNYDLLGLYTAYLHQPAAGHPRNEKWYRLRPDALKVLGVYFQHLHLDVHPDPFPVDEFLAFEEDEVRQGRDPMLVTATYDGKKRPVFGRDALPGGTGANL